MYDPKANTTVENIEYETTRLSSEGMYFFLEKAWMPTVCSWSPIYKDILEPFAFEKYTAPRLPIDMGPIDMKKVSDCPRVLRTTIKPEGTLEVRIPKELEPVAADVHRLLLYEYMINSNLKDFNVHLTIDSSLIQPGKTQRFPGWHGDGLQGGKFKEKLVCEHSYIAASSPATEICMQPFFLEHINEDAYNLFKEFDRQAKETNIYKALPGHFYLFDPYIVHRTPTLQSDEPIERFFIRLTVANKELPIEHNTLNPMWGEQKHESKLDIRDFLLPPDQPIIWEQYGLRAKDSFIDSKAKWAKEEKSVPQAKDTFKKVELSGDGEEKIYPFQLFPIVQPGSPTYADIKEPFELNKYTNPRLPIDLGKANLEAIKECPSVLRMPLKYPGDETVRIPKEFFSIKPLLQRLFTYEQNISPFYKDFAAHITIDHRIVEPNSTQRFPGFHGDDLQGGIFQPKLITAHSYIVTSEPTTEVCLQPFFVSHLRDTFEKVFDAFDQQAKLENVVETLPDHVYLVDPYNVHRSPVIHQQVERVFLRITFSPAEMLLPHNTVNPLFAETAYPGKEAIHLNESRFLVSPDREIPYQFYGIEKTNN